jgi:hypothetical protein
VTEFTPEVAGRVAQVVLFTEWRRLLAAGHLTEAGVLALRCRVGFVSSEFPADSERELLLLDVDEALAAMRGREMPSAARAPDDLSGIV